MKKKAEPSLTKLADAAFLEAAHKVVQRAINSGTPLVLWQDGAIKEVDAREYLKKLKPQKKTKRIPKELRTI